MCAEYRPKQGSRFTQEQLASVHIAAYSYAVENGKLPGPEFEKFIKELVEYKRASSVKTARLIGSTLSGDGWGWPYVFSVQKGGLVFYMRSVGPNGIDEDGGGDDVERCGDLRKLGLHPKERP